MKTAYFSVLCKALYKAELEIPDDVPAGEELSYVQEHINDLPVGDLAFVEDLEPEEAVDELHCVVDEAGTKI
jgi:hypothetical protein